MTDTQPSEALSAAPTLAVQKTAAGLILADAMGAIGKVYTELAAAQRTEFQESRDRHVALMGDHLLAAIAELQEAVAYLRPPVEKAVSIPIQSDEGQVG